MVPGPDLTRGSFCRDLLLLNGLEDVVRFCTHGSDLCVELEAMPARQMAENHSCAGDEFLLCRILENPVRLNVSVRMSMAGESFE